MNNLFAWGKWKTRRDSSIATQHSMNGPKYGITNSIREAHTLHKLYVTPINCIHAQRTHTQEKERGKLNEILFL